MNKTSKQIINRAREIARLGTEQAYCEAQNLLLDYLENEPYDVDAWLLLIRIECNSPLEYPDLIENYANQILHHDQHNAYALLFLAYAQHFLMGEITSETYVKLCSANDAKLEVMAMIEVAKARYLEKISNSQYEKALKKSIAFSSNQQTNLFMLGQYFLKIGEYNQAKNLFKKAIKNIQTIISDNDIDYDPTDIEAFFDYYYKGTSTMKWVYENLKLLTK